MKGLGLQARFALFGFAPLVVALIVGSLALSANESRRLEADVRLRSEATAAGVIQLLQMSDSLMGEQTRSAMKLFREKSAQLGPVSLGEAVAVGGQHPLNLRFGGRPQALETALVDSVSGIAGGTRHPFRAPGPGRLRAHRHQRQDAGRPAGRGHPAQSPGQGLRRPGPGRVLLRPGGHPRRALPDGLRAHRGRRRQGGGRLVRGFQGRPGGAQGTDRQVRLLRLRLRRPAGRPGQALPPFRRRQLRIHPGPAAGGRRRGRRQPQLGRPFSGPSRPGASRWRWSTARRKWMGPARPRRPAGVAGRPGHHRGPAGPCSPSFCAGWCWARSGRRCGPPTPWPRAT